MVRAVALRPAGHALGGLRRAARSGILPVTMRVLIQAAHIARASLLAEWRGRQVLSSVLLLAVLTVLLVAFAVGEGTGSAGGDAAVDGAAGAAAGAFWLAMGLACASGLSRWGARSRAVDLALRRAGARPAAVYLGQSLSLALVLLVVALALALVSVAWLGAWGHARPIPVLASLTAGVLGLSGLSVGLTARIGRLGGGWTGVIFLAAAAPLLAVAAMVMTAALAASPFRWGILAALAGVSGATWLAGLWTFWGARGGLD